MIRTRQLTRYYPAARSDPVKAVDSVDLELAAGEMAVVLGPSASGKTTLLGLIAGLDRPSSGRVELFGQPLADLSDAALALLRRTRVGLVFQDFKLLPGLAFLGECGLAPGARGHAASGVASAGRRNGSIGSELPRSRIGRPSNSAADSSSGSRWPARW